MAQHSLTYQQLLHDTAIRLSALLGSQVATITATYDTATLTAANFKSADWPFNSFRDAIIMAVEDFAWAIADTGGHPWRSELRDITADLVNHANLPAVSITNLPIIGVWGTVYDATDSIELTEQPLDVIRRINQAAWRTYPSYFYKIQGGKITHTRPDVVIEVCVFSRADQVTLWNANGLVPLPDVLQLGLASRAIAILTKDGAFMEQAAFYAKYAEESLARIRAGSTVLPAEAVVVR
jgi:hypothetical protein